MLEDASLLPAIVHIREAERHAHPLMAETKYPWLPQLLYRGQLLGSLEYIRELCLTMSGHDTAAPSRRDSHSSLPSDASPIWSIAADGPFALSASADGVLRKWTCPPDAEPQVRERLQLSSGWLTSVCLIDGMSAVAAESRGALYVVDVQPLRVRAVIETGDAWINAVDFDRTTATLVSAADVGSVRTWKLRGDGLELCQHLELDLGWVNSVACSKATAWLASASGSVARIHLDRPGKPAYASSLVSRAGLNSLDLGGGVAVVAGQEGVPIFINEALEREASGAGRHSSPIWGTRFSSGGDVVSIDALGTAIFHLPDGGSLAVHNDEPLIALSRSSPGTRIYAGTRHGNLIPMEADGQVRRSPSHESQPSTRSGHKSAPSANQMLEH